MNKKFRMLFGLAVFAIALVASLFFVVGVARAEEVKDDDAPVAVDAPVTEGEAEAEAEEGEAEEGYAADAVYAQVVGQPATAAVGDTISFRIMVVNHLDTQTINIAEDHSGFSVTQEFTSGAMTFLDCTYTVTEEDGEAGSFDLLANATIEDGTVFVQNPATVTIGEPAEEETPAPGGDAAPQEQGGNQQQGGAPQGGQPGGPQGGVPATGDASMLPMVLAAVSGLSALAGSSFLRRRD